MRKTAAIILAAGESSRFGRAKQLLELERRSLVGRAVDAALGAKCSPVIVVAGAAFSEIERELRPTSAIVIENENWKRGIGTSIRAGVRHLMTTANNVGGVILLVCDQPFVDSQALQTLIEVGEKTHKPIVASNYANTLGVPALFDRSLFDQLLSIEDSTGAKSVIMSKRDRVAEVSFPEGKIDIDTAEQWNEIQSVTVPRKTSAA
jgi:molybdenum cofactor cytidylyltransferase